MPLRAFLLFGPKIQTLKLKNRQSIVSMPLRAFLLFGRYTEAHGQPPRKVLFQCPCGHFCFSDQIIISVYNTVNMVSMPLRAFLLFGPSLNAPDYAARVADRFNALAGIFAFRTQMKCSRAYAREWVSMPLRAFLLFGQEHFHSQGSFGCQSVSMPLRAFLLFGQDFTRFCVSAQLGFQCPCGHFCFSDKLRWRIICRAMKVSMPLRAFLLFGRALGKSPGLQKRSFNALAGIFAFRTQHGDFPKRGGQRVSMPLRAFLLFGLNDFLPPPRLGRVSMPLRAFLLFGHNITIVSITPRSNSFNALAGIFAFRTEDHEQSTQHSRL